MDIRKRIYSLTDTELARFQDAVNAAKADGSYDEFIERHHHSMMTATLMPGEAGGSNLRNVAHRGPAFLPWHRYFLREFELMLQDKRPGVTLPYWDWETEADPFAAPLWSTAPGERHYVGGDGTVTTGPFAGWTALVEAIDGSLVDRPGGIIRNFGSGAFPTQAQVDGVLADYPVYDTSPWRTASAGSFRNRLEGWLQEAGEVGSQLHNAVHVWIGGDMGPGTSPNDPVFFLHHGNIDRIWAAWQHAHPASGYLPQAGGPPGHNGPDAMQFLTLPSPTPNASLDYRRTLGYVYDTDPPLVDLATPVVSFADVPTLEQTWRAAVFHVRAGSTVHLQVVAGSGPNAPYSLTPLGGSVTHVPPVDEQPYDEVRVWFAFTGEAAPGPAPVGGVQILCVETGEVFDVTLTGSTVPRPTTGVVFALDRSGSMGLPAGTGSSRLALLKEAVARSVELIRDGSGAGLVSFDHDAYPGVDLEPFDPATSHRDDVLGASDGLTLGGATSIGDGLVLGRATLGAGAGPFDGTALVALTDGLENSAAFLADVGGSIDARTFAVGLGSAEQVSSEALSTIAAQTDGYLLLTGALTPATDSYFLLSKYFQQILVSATNEDIVTDPDGYLLPGTVQRIPFHALASDIEATVVLLYDNPVVSLSLRTPDGQVLDEAAVVGLGGTVTHGTNQTFARFALPLGGTHHGGGWEALLEIDARAYKRLVSKLRDAAQEDSEARAQVERLLAHGARYSVTVTAWSNVRMRARLDQDGFTPGARARVTAVLTEHGLPVDAGARVVARVVRPDGVTLDVPLAHEGGGAYAGDLVLTQGGAWRVLVQATGRTRRGERFTRDQLLGAVAVRGTGAPPRGEPGGAVVDLVGCLSAQDGGRRWFEEHGIDVDALLKCLLTKASGPRTDLEGRHPRTSARGAAREVSPRRRR